MGAMKDSISGTQIKPILGAEITSDTDTDATLYSLITGFTSLKFIMRVLGYTDGTYTLKLLHKEAIGDAWAEVPDKYLIGLPANTALGAIGAAQLGYCGPYGYVTARVTSDSVTTGAYVAVVAEEGNYIDKAQETLKHTDA